MFSNLKLHSQTVASICKIFQNIYRSTLHFTQWHQEFFLYTFTPTLFFKWHLVMFCFIIREIWWDSSNSYIVRGWSAFKYFRKIALSTSLRKARKSRNSSPSSLLIQHYTHALKNNIVNGGDHHFFHSGTNPVCGIPDHSVNKTHNIGINLVVVVEYIFFQLCSNAEQISRVKKIQKKLCKPHCCHSSQLLPPKVSLLFFAWCVLFKVATFLFCSCLSPVVVHMCNLFLLSSPGGRILLSQRWVSRREIAIHKYMII